MGGGYGYFLEPHNLCVFLARCRVFSWGVNKSTTQVTSEANDFVKVKGHARKKPLLVVSERIPLARHIYCL